MDYITKTLKKNGLYVAILPYPNHNMIYISWKIEDVSSNNNLSANKKRLLLN